MSAPPDQVHIAPPAPRHSSRPLDLRRLAGLPGDGPPGPAAALDLPAALEYASGCQRSHCRVLAAPVRQPFSVASAARELPSGGVAVQFTLTSNLAVPAQLARLALQPQPGFALSSSLLDGLGLLPASLDPGASLTAAFLLVPEGDAGDACASDAAVLLPAKLQPSVLSVDYTIDSRQQCGVAAAALGQHASGSHHSSQQQQHGREADGGGVASAPAPQQQRAQQGHTQQQRTPGADALELLERTPSRGASRALNLRGDGRPPGADDSGSEDEGPAGGPGLEPGGRQLCSFRHLVTLERPASEEGSSGERAGRSCLAAVHSMCCSSDYQALPAASHCPRPAAVVRCGRDTGCGRAGCPGLCAACNAVPARLAPLCRHGGVCAPAGPLLGHRGPAHHAVLAPGARRPARPAAAGQPHLFRGPGRGEGPVVWPIFHTIHPKGMPLAGCISVRTGHGAQTAGS